jgi:hypothetical protein
MFLKLTLIFFFSFLLPLFVFLTQVLYGGIEPDILKVSLNESTIYTRVSSLIINPPVDPEAPPSPDAINTLLANRFTPEYVKVKTEKLIDDSYLWLTKDGPSPVLSFSELKDDLLALDPTLQMQFQEIQALDNETNDISGENSLNDLAIDHTTQQELDSLTTLTQNNFTVPVGEYFGVLKSIYSASKIIQPILGILLLTIVFVLVKITDTTKTRLRWTGAMCLTAAIVGFGMVFFNAIAISNLVYVSENSSENLISTFSPIILEIMNAVFAHFSVVQNYINIGLAVVGLILICSVNLQQSYNIEPGNTKSKLLRRK